MLYNLDTSITDATLWHRKQAFGWNDATNNATLDKKDAKKRTRKVPVPLGFGSFILLEVTLQQALQSLAMAGLVAGHLNELGTPGSQGKVLAGLSNFGHLLDKC